jgi:hypothetical protein
MLAGVVAAVLAYLGSRAVPASAWLTGGIGAAIFLVFVAVQWQTRRRVATYQKRRNARASAIRDQVLSGGNPPRPYFVYLRPFDIDGAFVEAPRRDADSAYVEEYGWPTSHHDLESALALLVYPFGDLVALSDDAGKAGAGYVRSTDMTWQDEVRALCDHAEGIFVVPFDFQGTAWEVEMLQERGRLAGTFFVMPARPFLSVGWFSRDFRTLWEAGRARYASLDLPEYDPRGAVVQAGVTGRVFRGFGSRFRGADRQQAERDLESLRACLAELSAGSASS